MKIFHLSDHLPNYHQSWGGAEQVAYRYIKLLADSGKAKIVVGAVKPQKKVEENFKFTSIRVMEDFFPEKLQVYVTGIKNRIFSFDPLAFFHLLMVFVREKPDVVHLHKTNQISLGALMAAKITGAKTVLGMYDYWYLCPGGMLVDQKGKLCQKFHGSWCQDCDAVPDLRFLLPLTSPWRRSIFNFFFKRVDAFTVLSNSQAKILADYGIPQKKIFLIRQVFEFEKKQGKVRKNMILFAGWLDSRKGLHVLIGAMKKVLAVIPEAKLSVLELQGIAGYKEKILETIQKLGLRKNITFYGRMTSEKFNRFLNEAQVVVVPEQWENMSPVIIIEAMMSGKTVIASRIGGIPEFIRDERNGLLVDRTSENEFAQKIIWSLQNPEEAEILGRKAARDIVKLCHKRQILADLLKLYQNLKNTSF